MIVEPISPELMLRCRSVQNGQVLLKILNNAREAVAAVEKKEVRVSFETREDKCLLNVTDSGPGIDQEIGHKIINPFFTTKGIGEGIGLGLSISRKIKSEHGGKLYLDEEHSNTRFVMAFSGRLNS